MPPHAASTPGRSGFPDWVLLDKIAHMGRCRDNTTTAAAVTSASCPIEVSFVVADPPALTRCFVDCPHLTWGDFFEEPPRITGADGAFLLITVIFPEHPDRSDFTDLFVYKSGPGIPSLELLPRPYPAGYLSNCVGVLSCGDHCLVVVPEQRFNADRRMSYDLHIFSSKTKSWSTKATRLASGVKLHGDLLQFTKVFALGGGSMAWVDLRNGILLCDYVAGDPEVRLIQLPPLMPINVKTLGVGFDGTMPCLDGVRDVTFRNGWFRFIEMGYPLLDAYSGQLNFRWMAVMFKRMIHSDKWEPCGTADSAELSPTDSCFPDLFPGIWQSEDKKLTLNNMLNLFPTLDLYNDNIVYMMAKMKGTDPSGWILTVDTGKKKLEKISSFSEERLHIHRIYLQYGFTGEAQGTHSTKDFGRSKNRQNITLLDNSLLAALDLLRNIETHVESLNRRYKGMVLPGSAPSLNPEIQIEAEYGVNDGRGIISVSEHLGLMGDLNLQLMSPIDAIKSKIRVAHGALYKLIETLPTNYFVE